MAESPQVVFIASHLGYPMESTPLGGGAMVGLRLTRAFAASGACCLSVLGSGSESPGPGMDYIRLDTRAGRGKDPDLVRLSEWEYADFCRDFGSEAARFILSRPGAFPPEETLLVVNDVSEAPDMARLAQAGYRQCSIWHVDVVEFFNRIYLGRFLSPRQVAQAFRLWEDAGLGPLTPGVLKLVFEKQRVAVENSDLLIVPSRGMAGVLEECYPDRTPGAAPLGERIRVVPWGSWKEDASFAEEDARRLAAHYQIGPGTRVLMTLSRISPEKGIDILLEALRLLEEQGRLSGDLCLFVCGEPAFMRGAAYSRRVREAAQRLGSVRVFFPGYLASREKQAYFRLAHLFVSPSVHESYGLTLAEAMRVGLPVLAGDHHGAREMLGEDCGRILLYEGVPAEALVEALAGLLADSEELRRMGERARRRSEGADFSEAARTVLAAVLSLPLKKS